MKNNTILTKSIHDELPAQIHLALVVSGYNDKEDMDSKEFWLLVEELESLLAKKMEDTEKEILDFLDATENLSKNVLKEIPSEQVNPSRIVIAIKDIREFIKSKYKQ